MKKALSKYILKSTLVISLSLSVFNPGITQESKYTGGESINSKTASGSAQEAINQMPEKFKWFEEAKFGLFIHWGLFSIPILKNVKQTHYEERPTKLFAGTG